MIIVRNVLAIVLGIVCGAACNMGLILVGTAIVPPPAGMDPKDVASIAEHMPEFGLMNFMVPFVAHALGTLVGALVAHLVAASHRAVFAYAIGGFFLVGGIAMVVQLPSPIWFNVLDLVGAYVPMAWMATVLGATIRPD